MVPALVFLPVGLATPAQAQSVDTVSRAVVQPLPPAASDDLNSALMRLAQDRHDVDALISAGFASLQLNDIEAAIGFLGRAKELSPENPRVAEGMGAAYVRSARPVEALRFFEEAEKGGINTGSLWADRGLANDLVGQNQAAQAAYRRALSLKDDSTVRQRLALSYAIAGERQPFEEALRPLLDASDFSAFRTRAFGLAVLDDADAAIEIARAVMPRDMADKLEPYLRFMPRLTKSQQAAAANLGIYPSASRIGRDDPRIASAAGSSDAALEPRGTALGANDTASVGAGQTQPRVVRQLPPTTRRVSAQFSPPVAIPTSRVATRPSAETNVGGSTPSASSAQTLVGPPASDQPALVASTDSARAQGSLPPPVVVARAEPVATPPSSAVVQATAPSTQPITEQAKPASGTLDLATAFADFAEPVSVTPTGGNVVDISTIKPKIEKQVEAAPPPPPAPKRIWLQLGIGQNRNLLRGDWRLKYRKFDVLKDKGPFVTPLGQTNRLLAGPFDSTRDARAALNALAAEGVESFVWTSPEGQEIEDLR